MNNDISVMNDFSFTNEESEYNINALDKSLSLKEDSINNQTNSTINYQVINSFCSYCFFDNEKDTSSILIDFVKEEKHYLVNTLSGFIIVQSVEIDKIDLGYLCKKVKPIIGELENYEGKNYKVLYFIIIRLIVMLKKL